LNSNWISRPFWPREKTKNQPISYHPSSSCINSFSICIMSDNSLIAFLSCFPLWIKLGEGKEIECHENWD
jgi:hypothetical protein